MTLLYYQETVEQLSKETLNIMELLGSGWFLLALIEFFIIIFLLIILRVKLKKNKPVAFSDIDKKKLKTTIKSSAINMDDVMKSIISSKELYKLLSRKCHPDRFINSNNHKQAENIFQLVSKNKRNYTELLKLKARAEKELNLIFE